MKEYLQLMREKHRELVKEDEIADAFSVFDVVRFFFFGNIIMYLMWSDFFIILCLQVEVQRGQKNLYHDVERHCNHLMSLTWLDKSLL